MQANRSWIPVDRTVSCFELWHEIMPWKRRGRLLIYRKRVGHESRKNFQLDLFDPADGHYECSAFVTNKTLTGPNLWRFLCGRGSHEQVYGELRNGFAFHSVPSQHYAANSAWQVLSGRSARRGTGINRNRRAHRGYTAIVERRQGQSVDR